MLLLLPGALATWQSRQVRLLRDFVPRNDTEFTEYSSFIVFNLTNSHSEALIVQAIFFPLGGENSS